MFARLAIEADFDEIIRMGKINVEQTKPHDAAHFDPEILRNTLHSYLSSADPTVWVVEHRRALIGFMFAGIYRYSFRSGLYTTQQVLFVQPENRGSRAAALLVKELIVWSKSLGAAEIKGGNDNGFHSDRTAGFLEHFGFDRVGVAMTCRLEN
jgi:L-amino acid N-acyltransferase YncA